MRNVIQNNKGFTLIEMAMVIMIVGIAIAGLAPLYTLYQKNLHIEATRSNVNAVISAIGSFRSLHGRYPCPASLTEDRTNTNYGRENCTNLSATAPGNCVNGICIEQSKRAALAYEYPYGTPRNQSPRVLVGFIPFRQLNIEENNAYDGYGDRLMYVVTEHLTCDKCFVPDQGGIDIVDDSGTTALKDMGTAHFLVFSYGENNGGAYTRAGVRIPCAGAGLEKTNCDYDVDPASADATYQLAQGSSANDNNKYDDVLNYFTQNELPLWQMSTAQQFAITQKGSGDVLIGATDPDSKRGDVNSDVRVSKDPTDAANTGKVITDELCNWDGEKCFSPLMIGGSTAETDFKKGGLKCPDDDPDHTGQFMVAIRDGKPDCRDDLSTECPLGKQMTGINLDGTLKCSVTCQPKSVSICPNTTSALPATAANQTYTVHAGSSRTQTYKCKSTGTWTTQGDATGVCDCTPGVVDTDVVPCDYGYTGNQTVTYTRQCPSGDIVETANTAACVCNPIRETNTRDCPTGWDGVILTERFHVCPNNTWTNWTDVAGGNSCHCEDTTEDRTLSCPSPLTGSGILQRRPITCTSTGVNTGSWTEVSRDCKCVTKTEKKDARCPDGYSGKIVMTRTLNCSSDGTDGTWSEWAEAGNYCSPIPPQECKWTQAGNGQAGGFSIGSPVGDFCNDKCGNTGPCYVQTGTTGSNKYMNYSSCACK